jgi:Secretion system C-terminal sorting domain/Reeler domain
MNRNLLLVFCATVLMIATAATMIDTGRAGKTDSPGEGNCSGCHSNTANNTGGGYASITTNIPGNTYQVGQTYTISVTINETGKSLFGVGVEALDAANGNAGTLVITNTAETHLLTASNGRINVVHQLNGGLVVTPGSKTFTFDWTAPATDIGYVKFYVGGVAASADADESNDNAYTTFLSVSSPTVTATGDINSALQFSVYPNPVTDVMHVYFPGTLKNGKMSADLISSIGQKVVDLNIENTGATSMQITVPASVADGVYFLRMEQDGRVAVRKIMIRR